MKFTPELATALIGFATTFFAIFAALLHINAQTKRSEDRIVELLNVSVKRLDEKIDNRFELMMERLLRVEQVMDTRIKHLEEKVG